MVNSTTSLNVPKVLFGRSAFSARTFGTIDPVTLERLARLESVMLDEIEELKKMMKAE